MSETLVAVIIGGLLTLAGGAIVEILKNRQASAERRNERQAARDALQREWLIDLQDAVDEHAKATHRYLEFTYETSTKDYNEAVAADRARFVPIVERYTATADRVNLLRSRVDDADLRERASRFGSVARDVPFSQASGNPADAETAMFELADSVKDRAGALIRSL